jgi:hypothetical protein
MLPNKPGKPNHTGKTPNKIMGKYRIVKLGTAIKYDKKKNTAYKAPETATTETLLAPLKPLPDTPSPIPNRHREIRGSTK